MSAGLTFTYARRMARLRARIFGDVVRKTNDQDYKVVLMFARRPWQRDLPKWYPPLERYSSLMFKLRNLGLYTDEHLDFVDIMKKCRKDRGKIIPKKGAKRAKKKK